MERKGVGSVPHVFFYNLTTDDDDDDDDDHDVDDDDGFRGGTYAVNRTRQNNRRT